MINKPYNTALKVVFTLSISLYVISLTQEGFCTTSRCGDNWNGITLIALGALRYFKHSRYGLVRKSITLGGMVVLKKRS